MSAGKLEAHTAELHPRVVMKIKEHSDREAAKGGYEAVGFVVRRGTSPVGVGVMPLNNHAPNPKNAFFVEPWEQYRAEQKLKSEGYKIVGVYHSHVQGEAMPSMMDHELARPGEFVFIHSVAFGDLQAYKEVDGVLERAELT